MQTNGVALNKKQTHGAIEILTNLSEEFIETIFEEGAPQEDEVIQMEK